MKVEKIVAHVPVQTTKEVVRYKLELTEQEAVALRSLLGRTNSILFDNLCKNLEEAGVAKVPISDNVGIINLIPLWRQVGDYSNE